MDGHSERFRFQISRGKNGILSRVYLLSCAVFQMPRCFFFKLKELCCLKAPFVGRSVGLPKQITPHCNALFQDIYFSPCAC